MTIPRGLGAGEAASLSLVYEYPTPSVDRGPPTSEASRQEYARVVVAETSAMTEATGEGASIAVRMDLPDVPPAALREAPGPHAAGTWTLVVRIDASAPIPAQFGPLPIGPLA